SSGKITELCLAERSCSPILLEKQFMHVRGSPSSVYLWWPDGLGKVSTHGIVYARLILDGQDYGVNGN
ncbi:acyl-coenzyme A oxidase, partial [Sarracenia purpurea var. burkii]